MEKNYNCLHNKPDIFARPPGRESWRIANGLLTLTKKKALQLFVLLMALNVLPAFAQTYCVPAPTSVDGTGIINFTMGTINNNTVAEANNYGDYSAQIVDVSQTVAQSFSITYATGLTYDTRVWVDWNNDFDFDDDGELVYTAVSAGTNPATLTGTITPPSTTTLGNHRIRVGGVDFGAINPCYTGTWGSFEDYTINVTAPPACTVPTSPMGIGITATTANLSWTVPALSSPTGYEYVVDTNATAPTVAGTPVTGTTVTGATIEVNTYYYLHVRTNCGTAGFSEWVTSPRFRYFPGDTCSSAIDLGALTSPLSSTTVGAANEYTPPCGTSNANEMFYSIVVPNGATLVIGLTASGYDSVHTIFYGNCAASTAILCTDTEIVNTTWENTTGSTQTVYWVQDGWGANTGTYTLAWTLTPAPACNIPRTVLATLTSATAANLSWTLPLTGTPTGYEYAVTTVATPPESGTATTELTVTGVTVTTNVMSYFHVRTTCGADSYSAWVTYPFYSGICLPAPSSVDGQGITNVTIGSINNTTGTEPNNYGNYTAQTVNVGQGVAQAFSITFSTGFTYDTKIWVDWNDNMSFADPGEEIYSGTSLAPNPSTLTGTFTVPATAALGNHRLRIGSVDVGPPTPCYTGTWGSYEDYTINVTEPPVCFTPSNAAGVALVSGSADLSWASPTLGDAPTGYEYIVDTVTGAPTVAGTPTTATSVTGYTPITDNTYYYLHVRTNCGNGSYSEWITSPRFRYLAGETCATAIDLGALTSPISSTTVGAANDYTPPCGVSNAADMFYSINVPVGYTLVIGLTASGYDSVHSIFYGSCTTPTAILCTDTEIINTTWENTTGSAQTVYWAQDGWAANTGTYTLAWTLTAPPTCNIPRNLTSTLTSLTTVDLTWEVPVTGTPIGYEYAVTTSNTPPASGTATTALTATDVTATEFSTNYVYVRANCGTTDGFSEWVRTSFYAGHCIPAPTSVDGRGIINVTIGSINNTTIAEDGNYGDYSDQVVTIGQGVEQPFSITYGAGPTYNTRIWVDWNNDLDFDDEGELVYTGESAATNPATLTGTITVPLTASLGNHRMRVGGVDFGAITPCYTGSWGSFEDYTINVTPPPACPAVRGLAAQATSGTTADVSWTAVEGATAYEYAVTTSATPPASGTATTEISVTGVTITTNVTNYLHVRNNCSADGYSLWTTYSFYVGYCIPAPTSVDGTGITNVTIGSINNTTAAETGNYGDFTNLVANIGQGVEQQFSVTLATNFATYDTKIWVDWNNDLDFNDAGEEVFTATTPGGGGTLTGIITVPATASLGYHRMRVGGVDFGPPTPCWTASWGSFEDYTINVTLPPTCSAPRNAVGVATAPGTANLSWSAPALGDAPVGYEYVVDMLPGAPTGAGTPTTETSVTGYTPLIDNTYYFLHVRANCGTEDGFSEWITSVRFRYLAGDTCASAINLSTLQSPYSSTTVGAGNDYTPTCVTNTNAPDMFYYIEVPNGYTLNIGQTTNGYDSVHSVLYGTCGDLTSIACMDAPDALNDFNGEDSQIEWENLTGSSQTVFWVQDGWAAGAGVFTLQWGLTGPVTCDVPRELTVDITSLTTVDVSWIVPNTGSPQGYEYFVSTSQNPPANGGIFTTDLSAINITVAPNTTNYLHVRSVCGDVDGNSLWVSTTFYTGYCVATNTGSTANYISGITTGGGESDFANTGTGFSGYTDYTEQFTVSTYAGGSFNITATHPTGSYTYSVWVDWNNDFDFDDAGETEIVSPFLTSPAAIGSVTVPPNTPIGTYRMRIRNANLGTPTPACGNFLYGEAEDYTLEVVATPTCFPPYALMIEPIDATTADVRWSPPVISFPTGYEYVLSNSATPPASGEFTTQIYIPNVAYNPALSTYLHVRSVCEGGDFSDWATDAILDTNSPEVLSGSVMVFKESNGINVTSPNAMIKNINIFDTRGRILYSQSDINTNATVIDGMQIQQQVLIIEINTEKGKVSKRMVY